MSNLLKNAVSYLSGAEGDEFVGVNIDLETHKLNIKSILGDGGFGKVYKCVSLANGEAYALKRLFVPNDALKRIQQEIAFLKQLVGHPNICNFVGAAAHKLQDRRGYSEYLILLEYCPGTLVDIIKSSGTQLFSSTEVLRLFAGVCNAVNHLHGLSPAIIHRDIKAENVIFSRDGSVKICDFGSATTKIVKPTSDWSAQQRGLVEDEVNTATTPCYRAPEMIDYYSNHEIGTKADVWALGCFLYFICYFELPFDDNKLAIVNAKYKKPNEHLVMFTPFLPIIRGVFKVDPSQRPSAQQILRLLENIAKDKNIDPNLPPFDETKLKRSAVRVTPPTQNPPQNNNSKSSWMSYLKGGAENILKEAKSASEKVVGAVVQASNLYSNEKLDEGQLIFTTVTSRIVAVSFPEPVMIDSIHQLISKKFGEAAYFFNLTKVPYPKEFFGGRIMNAGWEPLVPPSFDSILTLTAAIDRWLLVSPDNIVVVHCQNGTGSTATVLASYFLMSGVYQSATSALQYYAVSRYPRSSSIITASQKRYVEYIEKMMHHTNVQPHNHMVILCNLTLSSVPLFSVNRSNCKPFVEVYENDKKILSTLREPDVMRTYSTEEGKVDLPVNMGVKGDIRVVVYHARNYIGGKMSAIKMFQFCFNTAFIDSDCSSMRFPKSRLDGIARHENKFDPQFAVELSLSVQIDESTTDCPYQIKTSSLGITPPICCASNDEYNKMLLKIPDKGIKKLERNATVLQKKRFSRELSFEEYEDEEDVKDEYSGNALIDMVSAYDKPAPMSDPMSRKSPAAVGDNTSTGVLLDFLAPSTDAGLTSSSSAPNLAEMSKRSYEKQDFQAHSTDEFAAFFSATPTAEPKGHKRDKSVNLMDVTVTAEEDILSDFDILSTRDSQPAPNPSQPPLSQQEHRPAAPQPGFMFDPFAAPLKPTTQTGMCPDPFISGKVAAPPRTGSVGNNMSSLGSPLIPTRLGSGCNSPVINRSPRTSPGPARKNLDPFSDFKLDTKTAQMQFDKPSTNQSPNSGSAANPNQSLGAAANQRPQFYQQTGTPNFNKPNYFANTHTQGSVFSNDSKPWQNPTPNDAFGDLLSGQDFGSTRSETKKQTLREQRREELEKTMDPLKLKIMDWTSGKENNIRALLASLGEILWDGENRWPRPGMHMMIEPNQVKRMYRNASRVVHPDKQTGTPNEELAKAIQTELNDAYKQFEAAELS